MDPTPAIVNSIILPHGAYHKDATGSLNDDHADSRWLDSILSQKNRAENLVTSDSELWDIDGGETDRGFFCTVPKFARGWPPLRITTTIKLDQTRYSHALNEILELNDFFRAGKWRIHDLPLTKHLRQALTYWSNQRPNFKLEYESLPFGSKIIVGSLHSDVSKMKFDLVPDLTTERSWLSMDAFADEVSMPVEHLSSMAVSWQSLELLSHPHENISIVRITGQRDVSFIFKALVEDTHYMYHELRLLLSMESHPNIIARPHSIVLKDRLDSVPGIAGFLLNLYPGPTLQQRLQVGHTAFEMNDKVAWSCQLVSALLHVRTQPPGYFPDFKPNNIVFTSSEDGDNSFKKPVLLDFEQRGTWYTWAPPEVRYTEYLELLALTSTETSVRERYGSLLKKAFPHWSPTHKNRYLRDAKDGFNLAWTCLEPYYRSKAQMYAFGKVLWCIFEGCPSPDGPQNVESFLEDFRQDQQFPEFRLSPPVIQRLIRRCTAGASEWGSRRPGVVRDGERIVPWGKEGCAVTACETQDAATRWWHEELSLAEEFVRHQYVRFENDRGAVPEHVAKLREDVRQRPSLEEVEKELATLLDQHL
jgi:hypothetical protein